VGAIRGIQAKQIDYKEFLRRIMASGTACYTVYLNGKKAIYFGRNGGLYIENFPQAAQTGQ
jgi:uncharacterized protein YbcV (DUF1398 family)